MIVKRLNKFNFTQGVHTNNTGVHDKIKATRIVENVITSYSFHYRIERHYDL